jgi:hypothetical protein
MENSKLKTLRLICWLGSLLTALAVVLVPLILFSSQNRSDTFWLKAGWAVVLIIIAWAGIYAYLSTPLKTAEARGAMGGLAPALAFGAVTYALLSFALLAAQSLCADSDVLGRILLAAQVGLGALAAVAGLLVSVVKLYAGQTKNTNNNSQTLRKE